MKVRTTIGLLDEKDEEVKEGLWRTLRSCCTSVLYGHIAGEDENLDGEKKAKNAFLALRIQSLDEVDLTAEELSLLKRRIGKAAPPLTVLRCHRLLEGKDQKIEFEAASEEGKTHAGES